MNRLIKLVFVFLLLTVAACSDPYEAELTPAYSEQPVVGVLESMPERFSLWLDLLEHAGLKATLNLDANYTCFVPDNDAVASFLTARNLDAVTELSTDEASHLVRFHTIAGRVYSQSLFANGVLADSTSTGDFLSVELRPGGLDSIFINGEGRLLQIDISAINGIIHSLDRVLTPVVETLWDKLNDGRYNIMREAVAATGFEQLLDEVSYYEYNSVSGERIHKRRFLTCFVVGDRQYQQEGISSLDELKDALGAVSGPHTSTDDPLYRYVAYHIMEQQVDYAMLSTFPEDVFSRNLSTLATNELINLSQRNDSLVINHLEGEPGRIIIAPNINTRNGILHELNKVLFVQSPPAARVVWEPTDFAGLAALFSSNFRRSGLTATFREYIALGEVEDYRWEAIPADRSNRALSYYVANRNDAVPYGMMNYDCLVFQGGMYGWLEMETPAIVQGTYDLRVRYYSINSSVRYGKFLTILDGAYLGAEQATHGSSSTTSRLQTSTIGRVSFDETTSHTLRILASDDNAVYIDYFEFVPVD